MWGYSSVLSADTVRTRRPVRLLAAAATMALLVAACGDGEEPASEELASSADADPTAEASADEGSDAAPGEEDGTPQTDEAGEEPTEGSGSEGDASSGGDGSAGLVTIDGVDYPINETLLCEEFDDDIGIEMEREIELFAQGDDRAGLNVYIEEIAGFPSQTVSWQGPEGIFSFSASDFGDGWLAEATDPIEGPPVEVDGDTVRSAFALTLVDAMGGSDEVEVTFAVDLPSSTFACR